MSGVLVIHKLIEWKGEMGRLAKVAYSRQSVALAHQNIRNALENKTITSDMLEFIVSKERMGKHSHT